MIAAARDFVPVFIDTLNDLETTRRFNERFGSYPVLRVHSPDGSDIGGRLDTNPTAGRIAIDKILEQLKKGRASR